MKQFGDFKKENNYTPRIGAYGIITNSDGLVACLTTSNGTFLPGGGQDENETLVQTLEREVLEETGYSIKNIHKLAKGGQYCFASDLDCHLNKIEHFYSAEAEDLVQNSIEDDHKLHWYSPQKLAKILKEEVQSWAIQQYQKSLNHTATEYWANFFGIKKSILDSENTYVIPHNTLNGYNGAWVFLHQKTVLILSLIHI